MGCGGIKSAVLFNIEHPITQQYHKVIALPSRGYLACVLHHVAPAGVSMKIYILEHLESRRRFNITASSFDEAVSRTFDNSMAHWVCVESIEVDPLSACSLCGMEIDAEKTIDHSLAEEDTLEHKNCPACPDCGDVMAGDYEADLCLKCAFKGGLIDNSPFQDEPSTSQTSADELVEWKALLDQISHDLATPLSVINQYIRMNSEAATDSDNVMEMSHAAARSYGKVRQLIDHLRGFCRADELKLEFGDFRKSVEQCICETRSLNGSHNIDISYHGPAHLIGRFDAEKLERALSNLLKNAIEAMDEEGGTIKVSLFHSNQTAWIDVTDNGKGISKEFIDRIFERGCTHGKKKGTGLGLAYCKKIAEAHGGSIGVHSQEGEGTVFSLVFPSAVVLKAEKVREDERHVAILSNDEHDELQHWLEHVCQAEDETNVSLIDYEAHHIRSDKAHYTLDPID